jgi:hypothetical protein
MHTWERPKEGAETHSLIFSLCDSESCGNKRLANGTYPVLVINQSFFTSFSSENKLETSDTWVKVVSWGFALSTLWRRIRGVEV